MSMEHRVLSEWRSIVIDFSRLHNSSIFYGWANTAMVVPASLLSLLAGGISISLASSNSGECPSEGRAMQVASGILSLAAASITTLATTFKLSERSERHKVSADEFERLSREISVAMLLDSSERRTFASLSEFLKWCNDRINNLMDRAPPLRESAGFPGDSSIRLRAKVADVLTTYTAEIQTQQMPFFSTEGAGGRALAQTLPQIVVHPANGNFLLNRNG